MVFLSAVIALSVIRVAGNLDRARRPSATSPLNTLDKTYRHRVAEAAATAYTLEGERRTHCCRRLIRGLPRRFRLWDRLVEIEAVVER